MNTTTAPDALLEQAWARRMEAYRAYNALPFGEGTEMSPEEAAQWAIVDEAEEVIRSTVAETPRGAAIQLWASLYHSITSKEDDEALTRGDLHHFEDKDSALDWNARLALAALRSLQAMEAEPCT